MKTPKAILRLKPCPESREWLRSLPRGTTMLAAWRACESGGWLGWVVRALTLRGCLAWSTFERIVLANRLCTADEIRAAIPWPTIRRALKRLEQR